MDDRTPNTAYGEQAATPVWLALAEDTPPLDVRPILAGGDDPLLAILNAADGIDFAGSLVIDAPFNPLPLRRLLAARGFSSYGRLVAPGHWRIFFHLDGGGEWEQNETGA